MSKPQPHLSSGTRGFYNERNEFVPTGSKMGRTDLDPWYDSKEKEFNEPFRVFRMRMSPCGAYDHAGAYWGTGDAKIGWMYRAYCAPFNLFIRARTRREAKERLKAKYPLIKFLN